MMSNKDDIWTLLDLDGMITEQGGGHWTKFEVRQVAKTSEIPHGIRYSLTLHNKYGERIMGFDNAHFVQGKSRLKHQNNGTYDHRHRYLDDKGVCYDFVDAHQLLKDFWLAVDKILSALGFTGQEE